MKKSFDFMFMVVLTATAFAQDEATNEEGPKDGWSKRKHFRPFQPSF